MLKVSSLPVGRIQENTYVVSNEAGQALIFDPGAEAEKIIAWIEENNWQPLAILLTHCHYDHIGALDQLRDYFHIESYVHEIEQDFLSDSQLNLSALTPQPFTQKPAENVWPPKENQQIENFNFKVIHTPGHSPGHVIYRFDEDQFIISGDLVFQGSIGRTDLPMADHSQIMNSIEREIKTLDPAYRLYPGHGNPTTIAAEIAGNPFLQ